MRPCHSIEIRPTWKAQLEEKVEEQKDEIREFKQRRGQSDDSVLAIQTGGEHMCVGLMS